MLLARYRKALSRLEAVEFRAPEDLLGRVMAALPEVPPPSPVTRFIPSVRLWLQNRGRWLLPSLGCALAVLLLVFSLQIQKEAASPSLVLVPFEFHAPTAGRVELVGTFSEWAPGRILLHGPDAFGYWGGLLPLPEGHHEYLFLVDGTHLLQDPNALDQQPDGFGLNNSALVVYPGVSPRKASAPLLDRDWEPLSIRPASYAVASSGDALPEGRDLLQRAERVGIDTGRMRWLFFRLGQVGIASEHAKEILAPLFLAVEQAVPVEPVLAKIQEGILKRIPEEPLALAIKERITVMKEARRLLRETQGEGRIEPNLQFTSALALEQYIPEGNIREILEKGRNRNPWQVIAALEGVEDLRSAGLEGESLRRFAQDWLGVNRKPSDIYRAMFKAKGKDIL